MQVHCHLARCVQLRPVMRVQAPRLLVVDDEPDIVRLLQLWLGAAGYDVVAGYGAEDALRKVRRERFNLLITDLAMPRMSGVDLIAEVKGDARLADLPIICVTAFVWDGLGRSAGDLGCDGFVSKPIDRNALVAAVERCLALRNEPARAIGV